MSADLDFYQDWVVEVNSGAFAKDQAICAASDRKGNKVRIDFPDMTRGQVILSLRRQGYVNWRFITDEC